MDRAVGEEIEKRLEAEKVFSRLKLNITMGEDRRQLERERPYNADLSLVRNRVNKLEAQLSDKANFLIEGKKE